jgi:uncharacterized protein
VQAVKATVRIYDGSLLVGSGLVPEPDARVSADGQSGSTSSAGDEVLWSFAFRLSEADFKLVLVARRESVLAGVARDLEARQGVETLVLPADLGRPAGIEQVLGRTARLPIGLLVAAAGFGTSGRFVDSRVAG